MVFGTRKIKDIENINREPILYFEMSLRDVLNNYETYKRILSSEVAGFATLSIILYKLRLLC